MISPPTLHAEIGEDGSVSVSSGKRPLFTLSADITKAIASALQSARPEIKPTASFHLPRRAAVTIKTPIFRGSASA